MQRLAPTERWTHYFTSEDAYVQLDYTLLSPALAARNPHALPHVVRDFRALRTRLESSRKGARSAYETIVGG